ncbi:hypothetical protein GCM10010116_25070 [Microbispora rosea subsp. aerata]|nr:DUF4434 domain-containing protein [Microbispora rosea]GGO12480.1 hypothetical protein GCM10010116_25070 [Microbispora rosea subsp. aerata]GIH54069.1 hypothetical protein Mro02_09830 [Microbispora rosea subsp. aerata]GLJ85042.1 hypothetical protein GCM10017588_37700 [Microbispora rosea subsp. aerata]
MRWLTLILGVAILAGVASVVIVLRDGSTGSGAASAGQTAPATPMVGSPTHSEFTDPCGTFQTTATTPYAVTGYWLIPTSDPCTWRHQLEAIHRLGGDTVVRLGFGLSARKTDDEGRILEASAPEGKDPKPDARYARCVENGLDCVRAAEKDLQAANPDNKITGTYVYRTDERFGTGIFRCPQIEHEIVVGSDVFFRLLAPEDGSDDPTCDFASQGRGYHLILVSSGVRDSLSELLDLGDRFGIKVFPALPLAPRDPEESTRADPRHIGTLTTLTRRILQDYGDRFNGRDSLGGVYQPFELQLRDWPDPSKVDTLQVYAEQHLIVEQELPDKPILVSPYIDSRRRVKYTSTPAQVAKGFKELARTGVEIIAPQDGRGTGKVGLFWPNWKNKPVDDTLEPVVGESTYATAYYGATRDYYRAMSIARQELVQEGVQVELWANVEAFEPSRSAEERCGRQGTRGRTDKPRLDTQVTLAAPYVSKIISYMWSDFFTCGSPSLSEEIAADWDRPIPIEARRRARQIQDGLEIRGYHLGAAKVTLSWPDLDTPRVVDSAAVGWHDTEPIQGLPQGTEKIWIPVDWATVPDDVWIRVEVTSADGRKAAEPVYYHHTD